MKKKLEAFLAQLDYKVNIAETGGIEDVAAAIAAYKTFADVE